MKASVFAKVVCAAGLSAACVMGLAACSGQGDAEESGSGLVAATVNGAEIPEDRVTAYIDSVRAQMSLDTDDAWGEWLVSAGYTPESLREMVLDSYIEQELVRQGAQEKGVTAAEETVDSYVNAMKSYYGTDEEWQSALASAGLTEEEYLESIELSLLQQGLNDTFVSTEEPTEEEMVEYLATYGPMFDGAKRSSHILFNAEDEATAQDVLNKINNGELDFAAAATEYSQDTGSAADGGNVGLDVLTQFVTEYQDALDALSEGEVSGLVESSYGIHIIKCTYVFEAPEEVTSTEQFPEEILSSVSSAISSSKQSEAYNAWLTEYREAAEIVINPLPESVSYNIDMTPYQSEAEGEAEATEDATEESADDAADGSDAAADAEGEPAEGAAEGETTEEATTDTVVGGQIAADDSAADATVQQ